MRSNSVPSLLVAALLFLSLCATWMSVRYFFSLKELQTLQSQHFRANQILTATRSLTVYCRQYGQNNPEINPIVDAFLKKLELKPDTNALPELVVPESTNTATAP